MSNDSNNTHYEFLENLREAEENLVIARTCHESNRIMQEINDDEQISPPWYECSEEIKRSAIQGVYKVRANPEITAEDMHNEWMDFKIQNGWTYGIVKDEEKKTHPSLVEFDRLTKAEQMKDVLFIRIVNSLTGVPNA